VSDVVEILKSLPKLKAPPCVWEEFRLLSAKLRFEIQKKRQDELEQRKNESGYFL